MRLGLVLVLERKFAKNQVSKDWGASGGCGLAPGTRTATMHNFFWLLRPALKYRWTMAGIFFSSMMVALMWGLNIGALFPVLKVAFQKQSLQEWVDEEIGEAKIKVAKHTAELETAPTEKHSRLEIDIESEQNAITFYGYLKPLADRMPKDPFTTIVFIVIALVLGTIVKGIFVFTNVMLVSRLEQRVTFDVRQRFFYRCIKMSQSSFGEQRTSSLLSRFHADVGCISGAVRALAGTALREPLKMVACLVGACVISPRMLILSLVLTPITALTIRKLAKSIKRANRRSLEEVSALFGVLTEAFQGIETVQAFTLERNQRQRFYTVAKSCLKRNMRIALYNAMTKPITEVLGICVIALAIISGAYLTLKGVVYIGPFRMLDRPLDMTQMMAFFAFLIGATEPARKLSDVFNAIQAGTAASERLIPLLEQTPKIRDPEQPVPMPAGLQTISLKDISFEYNESTPVLVDINLEVGGGETIAIVGPNGCGKTTLINMLPRFHDPTIGTVSINGVDVRSVRTRDLRQRIGMVTQRSLLFDDTVYNNIRHGRLDASQADVVRAAKAARADKFINEKLENSYETVIGSAGGNLSGGQRQRLALARAIVRDPEILILDEATSQIDIESEQLIHQALEQFAKDRTVIMITHRLSTLELADRVVVMDQGRIADVGTHEELISRCDLYQRLHEVQFKRTA